MAQKPELTPSTIQFTDNVQYALDPIHPGVKSIFVAVSRAPVRYAKPGKHPLHGKPACVTFSGVLQDEPLASPGVKNITQKKVFIKWARGREDVDKLRTEANVYNTYLKDLQGKVVPEFYGFFNVRGAMHCQVGCLIMEYCASDNLEDQQYKTPSSILQAYRRLHDEGCIGQGGLYNDDHWLDHFLVAPDRSVRIVGFSKALRHMPCHVLKNGAPCKELARLKGYLSSPP